MLKVALQSQIVEGQKDANFVSFCALSSKGKLAFN